MRGARRRSGVAAATACVSCVSLQRRVARRPELRNIASLGNHDLDLVVASVGQVEVVQRAPEATGLDPHDRILLRIEIRARD